MSVNEVNLALLSDLSYINLPKQYRMRLGDRIPVTLKELSDFYLTGDGKGILGNESGQENAIQEVLKACQSPPYSNYNIVGYENSNKKGENGLVAYAVETEPKNVSIVYRGSEMPPKDKVDAPELDGQFSEDKRDWFDNGKISANVETEQQKAALEFLEKYGARYENIYLSGHSKGGNDALYATIMSSTFIKDKIRWCATFNAPGFGPEFIKDNELMIKLLVEAGIISEYQNVHDFVSSLMKNPSKPIVIEPVGKNIGTYDKYHYIYAMENTKNGFKINVDGKKDSITVLINGITGDLLEVMTPEEINSLII